MARGYLNSLSFPAKDLEQAMELLSELRKGISYLVSAKLIEQRIYCNLKASQLPLTSEYTTLPQIGKLVGPGFRDTFLFFLQTLDQKSPAQAALTPEAQDEAFPSVVEEGDVSFDPNSSTVLVSCALDNGVLLSLGTNERWSAAQVPVSMLTATAVDARSVVLDNVCGEETSKITGERMREAITAHRFDNWGYLTSGVPKAEQLDDWFSECENKPGLEQVIMRAMSLASKAEWFADGELVKKLHSKKNQTDIFEVRAFYNGSNNVRLLFGRNSGGEVVFGYGGQKTSPNWYEHAMTQARTFINAHTTAQKET